MVNVWLGRAMTYDIVSAALVFEIERLHAGGMPGCLFAFYTTPMMSASRALAKLRVYMPNRSNKSEKLVCNKNTI